MSDLVVADHALPTGSAGYRSSGFYGMFFLILSEGALFAYLLFSYFYFSVQPHAAWPPGGPPNMHISLPNTVILLVSSGFVWWGERAIRIGNHRHLPIALAIGLVLGIIFVGLQFLEWHNKPFRLSSSTYSSLFFTITGVHIAHVIVGLIILAALLLWSALGYFGPRRHAAVSIGAIYWHFVDAVWLTIFFTIFITPHLA